MAKLSIRSLILGLLVLLALIAFGSISLGAMEFMADYRKAEWINNANQLADAVIKANAEEAMERGLTIIILRQPDAATEDIRARLTRLRSQGDSAYFQALAAARNIADHEATHPIHDSLITLEVKRGQLEAARDIVDLYIDDKDVLEVKEPWMVTMSNFIEALAQIRRDAFIPHDALDKAYRDNLEAKEVVYLLSEYAGRERDILGESIAKGQPMSSAARMLAEQYRGNISSSLNRLSLLAEQRETDTAMEQAISRLHAEFLGRYEQLREDIYQASQSGSVYPVTAGQWFAESSRAIDSILDVAAAISQQTRFNTNNIQARQFNNIIFLSIASVVVCLIVGLTFLITTRRILMPMAILMSASDRIAEGDLQKSVSVPGNDEFSELAQSFEHMRLSLLRDIAGREQAEKELEASVLELEKRALELEGVNRELDQFAYVTSHDLKAPLRAIANLAQWIEEDMGGELTDDISKKMGLLRGRVHRMEALIGGILQYSRIGRTAVELDAVDTQELLAEVIDNLSPPESFTINIDDNMPIVMASRVQLGQIFANLISNAVKYHDRPDGHVHIAATTTADYYEFAVSDDGPGIAPEFHHKVFGIFQTLQARDEIESTGIGLTIVKKIIEEYGGVITLKSDIGKGTTFHFTWPRHLKGQDTGEHAHGAVA